MTETKHFNYEGNIKVTSQTNQFEIVAVEFLTPAKVVVKANGQEKSIMVNVDIINRRVYDDKGNTDLSDLIFSHLDSENTLPEDFFAATEDLQNTVAEFDQERVKKTEEILGEHYE
jgi:hypothetical protein